MILMHPMKLMLGHDLERECDIILQDRSWRMIVWSLALFNAQSAGGRHDAL